MAREILVHSKIPVPVARHEAVAGAIKPVGIELTRRKLPLFNATLANPILGAFQSLTLELPFAVLSPALVARLLDPLRVLLPALYRTVLELTLVARPLDPMRVHLLPLDCMVSGLALIMGLVRALRPQLLALDAMASRLLGALRQGLTPRLRAHRPLLLLPPRSGHALLPFHAWGGHALLAGSGMAAAAIAMWLSGVVAASTAVSATGFRCGRARDRQRGDARGEK